MVKITEITPIKQPGLTSFLIEFEYNEAIINALKGIGGIIYHKKLQAWEAPVSKLSLICDTITFLDDIQLNIYPETENATEASLTQSEQGLTPAEIQSFKFTPFKHQIDAINYGLNRPKWLLLDSMGLGKTLEIIGLAETLHKRGNIDHCLVIVGVDSLRQNWKAEIQRFSNESVLVLGEKIARTGRVSYDTLSNRAAKLKSKIEEFFVVVNITALGDDKILNALIKGPNKFGLIAFDEAHRASRHSNRGANLLKLDSTYKVAASGTPIVNSPLSAYLILNWTGNDHSTLTNFKSLFCKFGGFNNSQIVGYQNLDVLKEELDTCSLRRTFDQVRGNMPTKTIDYELVEMSDQHQKFYDAIKRGVKEEADKIELKTNNLLALTTRLRQATACPGILTSEKIDSSKIFRAAELVEDFVEQGEKVLVLSVFKEPIYQLAAKLDQFHPLLGTGDQPDDLVNRNITDFRNSDNCQVLLGTHGKLGTGYSMPECHYMICLDQPFTDAQFSQSVDRIYRITSDQPVFIKVLVCQDTIDERVREIVETKKELADFLVDGKDNAVSAGLEKELRDIITSL